MAEACPYAERYSRALGFIQRRYGAHQVEAFAGFTGSAGVVFEFSLAAGRFAAS